MKDDPSESECISSRVISRKPGFFSHFPTDGPEVEAIAIQHWSVDPQQKLDNPKIYYCYATFGISNRLSLSLNKNIRGLSMGHISRPKLKTLSMCKGRKNNNFITAATDRSNPIKLVHLAIISF